MYIVLDRVNNIDPNGSVAQWTVQLPAQVTFRAVRLCSLLMPAGITNPVAPGYILININVLPPNVFTSAATTGLATFVVPMLNAGVIWQYASGQDYDQTCRNPGAPTSTSRIQVIATDATGAPIADGGANLNWRMVLELSDQ